MSVLALTSPNAPTTAHLTTQRPSSSAARRAKRAVTRIANAVAGGMTSPDQPDNLPHRAVFKRPAGVMLHHLLIAQLDAAQLEFGTGELAELLGIQPQMVRLRIRSKQTKEAGERREVHRLDFREAVLLIRRVCTDGRRLPDLDKLYCHLLAEQKIDLNFPHSNPSVRLAEAVFDAERQRVVEAAISRK